jgi:glycosyltransferase involved in cell wall biosynthesis
MRILTFSSLYPNAAQPRHGLFVENRLLNLLADCPVTAQVAAPVPWFPWRSPRFGARAVFAAVPRREERHGLAVHHPRYPLIPKVGMSAAPYLMARACLPFLRRLRREFDYEVIDAHYFYPDGVAAALLGRWLRLPVVITARGSDINLISGYALPRAWMRWAMRQAKALVAVSEALGQRLRDLGAEPGKVQVLRNGVDLDLFRPDAPNPEPLKRRLGIDGPLLLSVGHLAPVKGHDLTIASLPLLPGFHLALIGEGPERARLEALARERGVAERVHFLGPWPQRELPAAYASADALVLSSTREGMPNVALESLACGTPVLGAPVGGIHEVVASPAAGRVWRERTPEALADAARALFAAKHSRHDTRRYAERFSWRETSAGQWRVFESCLGQAGALAREPFR